MLTFDAYSDSKTQLINDYMEEALERHRRAVSQRFGLLLDSMAYSLQGAGKRFRPLLVLASAQYVGLEEERVLPAAAALEFVHTYSLIHDDLPALDDDDTRRGKPSNHKKFGEAVAILAGDALLTEAFGEMLQLREKGFSATQILAAVETLVHYCGVAGMLGGQLLDVTLEPHGASLPEVEFIHIHKTGAMILASTLLPAKLSAVEQRKLERLKRYGEAVGLAFQISDDLLDSEATVRYSRGPRSKPKPSYNQLLSHTEMREQVNALIDTAVGALDGEGSASEPLRAIAEFVRQRRH